MKFDVYCDESRPDVIHSRKPNGSRLVIGSLWLPTANRKELKDSLHALRDRHKIGSEFKWGKLSPSKEPFYQALIDLFFAQGSKLRFRCISVDREQVDLVHFHQGDMTTNVASPLFQKTTSLSSRYRSAEPKPDSSLHTSPTQVERFNSSKHPPNGSENRHKKTADLPGWFRGNL